MRKLMVGLMMVVGLLAVTPPAMAQGSLVAPGSLDPVGLITSGAVLPFLGQGLAGTAAVVPGALCSGEFHERAHVPLRRELRARWPLDQRAVDG